MDKSSESNIIELLESREKMADYLSKIMSSGDSRRIISVLGDIARARGMAALARETGLNRESLYKTFKDGREPKFSTVVKIMSALHLTLQAVPTSSDS